MTKFRIISDMTKETEWLNQMAAEGHALVSFLAGFYTFEDCQPGKYVFKVDLSDSFFSTTPDYRDYRRDTDTTILGCWSSKVYLRKEASKAPIADYPNTDALLEYYIKARDLFKLASLLELICVILELYAAMSGFTGGFLLTLGISIILLLCMQMAVNSNQTILKLREKKGERPKESETKMNRISPVLIIALAFCIAPFVVQMLGGSEVLAGSLQLISFVLLAVGIVKTRHIWGK